MATLRTMLVVGEYRRIGMAGLAVAAVLLTGPSTAVVQEEEPPDVTGTWHFVVELDIGVGEPTMAFEQDGETLTGIYTGLFGTAEVTGTVTGDRIEFRFGTGAAEAIYVGTLEGDAMQGTCDYGGVGQGTWEAERQP